MYRDRKSKRTRIISLVVALVILGIAGLIALEHPSRGIAEETEVAIASAVRASAVQCYAVEGMYPPDLEYLQENYGLQVNTRDYYIVYDAFAANIAPSISVIRK